MSQHCKMKPTTHDMYAHFTYCTLHAPTLAVIFFNIIIDMNTYYHLRHSSYRYMNYTHEYDTSFGGQLPATHCRDTGNDAAKHTPKKNLATSIPFAKPCSFMVLQ